MTLVQGFTAHCQIPPDCVSLAPVDKEIEPGAIYGVAGAAHFDTSEGYWCLGLIVTLRESATTWPQSRILLEIDLREQAGKFLVRRGKGDNPREIDISDQKQREEFYDSIATRVKQFYTPGPDVLPDDTTVRRIGFISSTSH